jgi:hypothetical protein
MRKGVVTDTSTLRKEHHLSGSKASSARPSGSGAGGCSGMEMKMYEKW